MKTVTTTITCDQCGENIESNPVEVCEVHFCNKICSGNFDSERLETLPPITFDQLLNKLGVEVLKKRRPMKGSEDYFCFDKRFTVGCNIGSGWFGMFINTPDKGIAIKEFKKNLNQSFVTFYYGTINQKAFFVSEII